MTSTSLDDPHERSARANHARASSTAGARHTARTGDTRLTSLPRTTGSADLIRGTSLTRSASLTRSTSSTSSTGFILREVAPDDPRLLARLDDWQREAAALLAAPSLPAEARPRVEDSRRILAELARVLGGLEEGEGRARDRRVTLAFARGRAQGICAWIPCRRAVFVELLATAPWNLVRGLPDDRAAAGAGRALVAEASRLSRVRDTGGRVALQAENPRCAAVYARLGFAPMRPSDAPLSLVPEGDHGFSASVLRLARGAAGPEELRMPWLLLDPARARLADVVAHAA